MSPWAKGTAWKVAATGTVTGTNLSSPPPAAFPSLPLTPGYQEGNLGGVPTSPQTPCVGRGRGWTRSRAEPGHTERGAGVWHVPGGGFRALLGREGAEPSVRSVRGSPPCLWPPPRQRCGAQGLPDSSLTRWRRWKANSNMVAARLWWMRYRGRRPCEERRRNSTSGRTAAPRAKRPPRGGEIRPPPRPQNQAPTRGCPGFAPCPGAAAGSCCCSRGVFSGGGTETRVELSKKAPARLNPSRLGPCSVM